MPIIKADKMIRAGCMLLPQNTRPLTGWAERYAKAHISLLTRDQAEQWLQSIDTMAPLLLEYTNTNGFTDANVDKQDALLEEFMQLWDLPYGIALIVLLHYYRHVDDFMIFVDAWKAFYYRINDYVCVDIMSSTLLKQKDVDIVLQTLDLPTEKSIVTQHMTTHFIDGLIVECQGMRYNASILGQLQVMKRNLCDDRPTV